MDDQTRLRHTLAAREAELEAARAELTTLRDGARMLEDLLASLPGMVYRCRNDENWTLILANGACQTLTGHPSSDLVSGKVHFADLIHEDDRERVWEGVQGGLDARQPYELRYRITDRRGTLKWVHEAGFGVWDDDGELRFLEGFITDITAQVEAENALEERLSRKHLLLQEIHHRVKNNLQMVSSLLGLQALNPNGDTVEQVLGSSRARVRAMALVHDSLYTSPDLMSIDLDRYIAQIVEGLRGGYLSSPRVEITTALESVHVGVDRAVPAGLIVNELVTNALKHAFPGERRGRVEVGARQCAPGRVELIVADDGIGLPEGESHHPNLGLRLVSNLVDQLDGSFAHGDGAGTRIRVQFDAG